MSQETESGKSERKGSWLRVVGPFVLAAVAYLAPHIVPSAFAAVDGQTAQIICAIVAALFIIWGLSEAGRARKA